MAWKRWSIRAYSAFRQAFSPVDDSTTKTAVLEHTGVVLREV